MQIWMARSMGIKVAHHRTLAIASGAIAGVCGLVISAGIESRMTQSFCRLWFLWHTDSLLSARKPFRGYGCCIIIFDVNDRRTKPSGFLSSTLCDGSISTSDTCNDRAIRVFVRYTIRRRRKIMEFLIIGSQCTCLRCTFCSRRIRNDNL